MIAPDLAQALAERYGTPLYAYDLDEVDHRVAELQGLLPPASALLYSLKANPLPAIAAATRNSGCRAEVSSIGELDVATGAGWGSGELLFSGPAKTEAAISEALALNLTLFSAESWHDVRRIALIAESQGRPAQILLRINPVGAHPAGLRMSGVPSQFGIDTDQLDMVAAAAAKLSSLELVGVHIYLGTQLPDVDALMAAIRIAFAAAESIAGRFAIRIVDLGGGFPWPFANDTGRPNLDRLRVELDEVTAVRAGPLREAELWFESGRYLTASSGTLLARVVDVKHSHGRLFVVLDAGIAQLGGLSGLGRILPPAAAVIRVENGRAHTDRASIVADVVGPSCTPLDYLARAVTMARVEVGDLVAVPNVGAYGATASLVAFLSQPPPLEICLRRGRVVDVSRLRRGHEQVAPANGDEREPRPITI